MAIPTFVQNVAALKFNPTGTGGNMSISTTAASTTGNTLIAVCMVTNMPSAVTLAISMTSAGWTQQFRYTTGSGYNAYVFTKTSTGDASGTGYNINYTVSVPSSTECYMTISEWSSCNATISTWATAFNTNAALTTGNLTIPLNNSAILAACASLDATLVATASSTPSATWANIVNYGGSSYSRVSVDRTTSTPLTSSPETITYTTTSNLQKLIIAGALTAPSSAPNAPTLTSPANGATQNTDAGVTFQGTYSSTDGNNANAYCLRIKTGSGGTYNYWNGSAWTTTQTWVSCNVAPGATLSVTVPNSATVAANGGTELFWSLAFQENGANLQGPFATDFGLYVTTKIAATKIFKWNVLVLVKINPTFLWNTGGRVGKMVTFLWNDLATVPVTKTFKWNVLAKVPSKMATFLWDVIRPTDWTRPDQFSERYSRPDLYEE